MNNKRFKEIKKEALACLPAILQRLLPDGIIRGNEYIARNRRRIDNNPGSFKINLRTGKWADFAVNGVRGTDVISLVAYLIVSSQKDAALLLENMIGLKR